MEDLEQYSAGEALVAQGASIVRLENNTQMQVAMQHPRSEEKILLSSLHELDLYPSMAEAALYMKPVGTSRETGKMTYAEGLSVRAAESLANRWSNSSFGCEIVGEDAETVSLAAVFLDYEQNTRHVVMARVAKSYKAKDGKLVRLDPGRLELAVKAEQSKVLREVILRSLPAGLKKEYENKVRKILRGGKVENRKTAIIERFKEVGISLEVLERRRGKVLKEWSHDDIIELLGIANAIRDGELSKESAFDTAQQASEATSDKVTELKEKLKTVKAEKSSAEPPTQVVSETTDKGVKENDADTGKWES
jgi:hypothetical protein